MISVQLLDELNCCKEGRERFTNVFKDKPATIGTIMLLMPKDDVLWLFSSLLKADLLPINARNTLARLSEKDKPSYMLTALKKHYAQVSSEINA